MIDSLDKEILKILKNNSRTPFLTISKELGCSEGTIRKRVKKMEEDGTIKKFTLQINPKIEFETIVCIKSEPKETKRIVEKLKKMDLETCPIMEVTGTFDIICIVNAENAKTMNELIDKIRDFEGVVDTQSFTIIEKN